MDGYYFCRPLRGLGILRGPDPRVTLAPLAHAGLPYAAASRLVDAESFGDIALPARLFYAANTFRRPIFATKASEDGITL